MKYAIALLIVVILNICLVTAGNEIVKARLESCSGCSLNQLLEVRLFAYNDIPTYERVEWKKISGAKPELIFLNDLDEEVERIPLSRLNREDCNELLTSRGFTKKENEEL